MRPRETRPEPAHQSRARPASRTKPQSQRARPRAPPTPTTATAPQHKGHLDRQQNTKKDDAHDATKPAEHRKLQRRSALAGEDVALASPAPGACGEMRSVSDSTTAIAWARAPTVLASVGIMMLETLSENSSRISSFLSPLFFWNYYY